jgi:hypothetical protein
VSTAAWLLPLSASIRDAGEKIDSLERRVYAANSQVAVANELSDLLSAPTDPDRSTVVGATDDALIVLAQADLNKPAVNIGGSRGCHYTTGEIIIVLGFLLCIIPGIIFLVIFC